MLERGDITTQKQMIRDISDQPVRLCNVKDTVIEQESAPDGKETPSSLTNSARSSE
jgi:hypothetical protein